MLADSHRFRLLEPQQGPRRRSVRHMSDVASFDGGSPPSGDRRAPKWARVLGDLVAIALILTVLWVVSHLLEWAWLSFLTDDFSEVLPFIRLQLLAAVAVRTVFLVFDPSWLRAWGEVVEGAFGLVVAVSMWTVFPFDFAAESSATFARVVIGLTIVGTAFGMVRNTFKGVRRLLA